MTGAAVAMAPASEVSVASSAALVAAGPIVETTLPAVLVAYVKTLPPIEVTWVPNSPTSDAMVEMTSPASLVTTVKTLPPTDVTWEPSSPASEVMVEAISPAALVS